MEHQGLRLTDRGTAVLAGAGDADVSGFDRWWAAFTSRRRRLGRWDPRAETLVAAQ